jgi:branched-chain amino acid transport system permease protein
METLLQHLVNGLMLGGTYALLGIGLTMVFGIMGVVNFAHGEFYAAGAFATYALLVVGGLPFYPSLAGAVLGGVVIGILVERLVLRPLRAESIETTMLVMIGLWILMQNLELAIWGGIPQSIPHPFSPFPIDVGGVLITPLSLFVFVTAMALIALVHVWLSRTRWGCAVRATFMDRRTAALMGIPVDRVYTVTFAAGAGLSAAAGALLGPVFVVYPAMGDLASLKAFSVVIMGGLGNVGGATIAGLVLGVVESLGAGYVSSAYKDAVGFLMIIAVLLFRPEGLFGRAERVG